MDQPFNSGSPKTATNTAGDVKPVKRSAILLSMIPGQLLFWGILIYAMGEGNSKALLGLVVYVILANIFISGKKLYDIWSIQYWGTDIFFKILFFREKLSVPVLSFSIYY